ncbi:MAG TPA: gamma-glutamylcyclotransferase family protein [Gammaproteobacteria bacterium]
MTEHLFVYGSLRPGFGGEMCTVLARHAEHIGEAAFQGRLYLVDWYPGAVPSGDEADTVRGDVFRLREPRALLPLLDRYEGCTPGTAGEYVRRTARVCLSGGGDIDAWIYLYDRPIDGLERIVSGDFLGARRGRI